MIPNAILLLPKYEFDTNAILLRKKRADRGRCRKKALLTVNHDTESRNSILLHSDNLVRVKLTNKNSKIDQSSPKQSSLKENITPHHLTVDELIEKNKNSQCQNLIK